MGHWHGSTLNSHMLTVTCKCPGHAYITQEVHSPTFTLCTTCRISVSHHGKPDRQVSARCDGQLSVDVSTAHGVHNIFNALTTTPARQCICMQLLIKACPGSLGVPAFSVPTFGKADSALRQVHSMQVSHLLFSTWNLPSGHLGMAACSSMQRAID